jgi:hypothetical protein
MKEREEDTLLRDLFAASARGETWPEPSNIADIASNIWWRARAAALLDEEIRRRERRSRPLALGHRAARLAALLALEAALVQAVLWLPGDIPAFRNLLAASSLAPTTAALLALAAAPALVLMNHLRREGV